MEAILRDLRYGIRMLLKTPGFTAIAVFTLALGIGANTAIFSVVNAVLLRSLPYEDSDRLVFISERSAQLEGMSVSIANFYDWRERNQVFEHLSAYRNASFNLTGSEQPERLQAAMVSASLFPLLGVEPSHGRSFREEEDKPGGEKVLILSDGLWKRRFGGETGVLGQSLTLDGESYTVVGVMPARFRFPPFSTQAEMWVPIGLYADRWINQRGNHPGIYCAARLRPGFTIEQARADMDNVAVQLEQQYPDSNTGNRVRVTFLQEEIVEDVRPILILLMLSVAFVLLIACANVANLLLARAATRHREISIRTALGAGRLRLVRQLLTESVALSIMGGLFGLVLAYFGVKLLVAASPRNTPRLNEISMDGSALLFTFLVSLLTGVIFGLVPALQASKPDLNESLKEGGRGSTGGVVRQRVRSSLVVTEVAAALMLLVVAGLVIRSFVRLVEQSPGFDPTNVLTMEISLPASKYPEAAQRGAFFEKLLKQVQTLPGVQSAGTITPLPLGGGWQTGYAIEGHPPPPPGQTPLTDYGMVSPDYFRAMGIPLLGGRYFTEQDRENTDRVAIVDETMARLYWPDEDPIGKRLKTGGYNSTSPWLTIVGVVRHVKNYGVDEESRVETFVPYLQNPTGGSSLVVRAASDPAALTSAIRSQVLSIDKDQPIFAVRTMEEVVANSIADRRIAMYLMGVFAAVALILSAVGIYGVMAYSVTQRTHEIGIRMALGAEASDVLKMVVKQGMVLTSAGAAIGLGASFVLTRFMANLLFGISAADPLTFAGVLAVLVTSALLACYIPARRATKVDPMIALRYE